MIKGFEINDPLSISKLFTFFKKRFEPGYFFKGESHDFFEVVCVISGRVGITAGKNVFTLNTGEMTFHPPGEFHAIRDEGDSSPEVIIFSFSATSFPTATAKIFNLTNVGINEIKEIYTRMTESFNIERFQVLGINEGKAVSAAITIKKLEEFLIFHLLSSEQNNKIALTQSSESFYNILSVMEANVCASLNTTTIARKCKISVPTLEKTVYKYLGYGAMTHYNTLKMQHAHTLLLGGASVKEASTALGFSNQNYFSARFKKYYGFPPSTVAKNKVR